MVSILVVGQYGMVGTMQTPIDMSYLADSVILLRYFESGGSVRLAISVFKKRTGNHERTIQRVQDGERRPYFGPAAYRISRCLDRCAGV